MQCEREGPGLVPPSVKAQKKGNWQALWWFCFLKPTTPSPRPGRESPLAVASWKGGGAAPPVVGDGSPPHGEPRAPESCPQTHLSVVR